MKISMQQKLCGSRVIELAESGFILGFVLLGIGSRFLLDQIFGVSERSLTQPSGFAKKNWVDQFFEVSEVGSVEKIEIAHEVPKFPWKTFLVNILGCSASSLLYLVVKRHFEQVTLYPVWLLSFCIGFTIFSAYAVHTMRYYEKNRNLSTLIYFLISPSLGLFAAYLTLLAARYIYL